MEKQYVKSTTCSWLRTIHHISYIILMNLMCLTVYSQQSVHEKSLSLHAPSGIKIAKDINVLKKDFSALAGNIKPENFKVTQIDYLPVTKGYVAILTYETTDKRKGNFAVINYPLIQSNNGVKIIECILENNSSYFMCENTNKFLHGEINSKNKLVLSCMDSANQISPEDYFLVTGHKK